ncbi:hypothetical protein [Flavisolibacter nicotianae]|uniref:hypothetical protein n=1 Tax=Flavisolibacter nicotianae TaxID=2364882 RepID=UPI000EB36F67|nr:hypothetical protein [Flavisolibacter nicotianae]
MQKKPTRKKLNQREIQKKIDEDTIRKFSFIVPRKGTIEFQPPKETYLNKSIGHDRPFVKVDSDGRFSPEGEGGHLAYYYIPQKEHDKIHELFKEFVIPESMHHDLIWVYLNMVFAACEATFSTNFYEQSERNQKELFDALELLEAFATGKILLRGISFEFKEKIRDGDRNLAPEYGILKSRKIKGHVAAQFIEKVLQNYKASSGYETAQSMYDHRKQYGKPDMFFGHKNAEKQSQGYYASIMFDYLRQQLFNGLFDLLNLPEKYEKEYTRLQKMYSRRKRFLFIGKLMMLSGLLIMKEESLDEDVIENIEKKLTPKMRSNKKTQKEIEEHNSNPEDGMLRVQLFHELF